MVSPQLKKDQYDAYALTCRKCRAQSPRGYTNCRKCREPLVSRQLCSRCRFDNPPNAYVCLKCYTVLRERAKVPFWKIQIPWGMSVVVIVAVLGWLLITLVQSWVEAIQIDLENRTQTEYLMNFQKSKVKVLRKEKLEKNLQENQNEN